MTHPNKTLLEALERIDAALEQTSLLNGVPYHPVKTVDEIRLDVPNVVGQINAFILLLNAYPAIRTALTAAGESEGELREALERLGSMEAMTIPFALAGKRSLEAAELVARIDFARAALAKGGEGDDR